jgi:hypothetical protein
MTIPTGYALVPIEPTTEMKIAGDNAGFWCGDKYRAMIAAAPIPPADVGERGHLTGHISLAEMVSTHVHMWREALGALLLNKAYDRSYVEHEQKALADIENACKVEMARASLAKPAQVALTDAQLDAAILEWFSYERDQDDFRARMRAAIIAATEAK